MKKILSTLLAASIALSALLVEDIAAETVDLEDSSIGTDTSLGKSEAIAEEILASVSDTSSGDSDETRGNTFDPYIYMANNILLDDSPSYKSFNYYLNADSVADVYKEGMTDSFINSVNAWETANLILNPGDAVEDKLIDPRGYYITVILSMLQNTFTAPDEINDKIISSDTKNASKLYKSFAKLYEEQYKGHFDDIINAENFTDEQRKYFKETSKKFVERKGFVASGEGVDKILDLIDYATKPAEYCNKFLEYCSVYEATEEWKECLRLMYQNAPKDNYPLCSALETLISSSSGWGGIVMSVCLDGMLEVSSELYKEAIGDVIKAIGEACPFIKGMKIGAAIGKSLMNLICSVDKTIESYHIICAYCDVKNLFKSVFLGDVINSYLLDKSSENAERFLKYLEMYFKVYNVGNDFGTDFINMLADGSIYCMLARCKKEYEGALKDAKTISDNAVYAYERLTVMWLINLYDENREQYEIYAPKFGNPDKGYLPVSSVKFEQDSVEWGFMDYDYRGYHVTVSPSNATCKNIVYSTSDAYVAEIDKNGNLSVRGVGECVITATSVDDSSISDELAVTVVQSNGADSTEMPKLDIYTIASPDSDETIKPASPKFDYIENSNGTITLTKYKDTATAVIIPSEIDGKKIVGINRNSAHTSVFDSNITFVSIPDSVTNIGDYAFYECSSLTSVNIPNSVISIGISAFEGCTSLISVTIPDSVTSIQNCAFQDCSSLMSVTLSNHIMNIHYATFSGCSGLASVTIPNMVTSIGDCAFSGCSGLTSVTIPNSVINIESSAFYNCSTLSSVIIPKSVTRIGGRAFSRCENLTSLTILGATEIASEAFLGCSSLSSIIIPNVISIGENAFNNCTNIESLEIPQSVEKIGAFAFRYCSGMTSIAIPNTSISIDNRAFFDCSNIITATVPCRYTFVVGSSKKLKTIVLLDDGSGFVGGLHVKSNLINITIPKGVTHIGEYAFGSCTSLTSVTLPNSVIEISERVFENCTNLETFAFPPSVTKISRSTFSGCKELTSVIIPQNITDIDVFAFSGCESLKDVYYAGTEDQWQKIKISTYNEPLKTATIHYNSSGTPDSPDFVAVKIPKPTGVSAPNTANISVQVVQNGTVIKTQPIGDDGRFDFSNISNGTYTFTFSANNCAPRAYDVTITDGAAIGLESGVKINLIGDINGDGSISLGDVLKANASARNSKPLTGYDKSVADINGDGKITLGDVLKMNAHARNSKRLW